MSYETNLTQRDGRATSKPEQKRRAVAPPVDVYESRDEFLLIADMPAVNKDELRVHLDKGQLIIEARRGESNRGTTLASEIRAVDYRRAFSVPQGIDVEKVAADLNDGLLLVHLPKSAALKPRQIQVRAG
jgi:HSP20 family molecular chaperone IbpA